MTNTTGLAAADALEAMLTKDDFEPAAEVDTAMLDATIDALAEARELVKRLTALGRHLADGGDTETARGLAFDVRIAVELVDGLTAGIA